VSDEEKKASQAKIYKYLFSTWMAKVAIIQFVTLGAAPMMMYMIFGNIMTHLTNYYKSIFMGKPEEQQSSMHFR
jgi:hypothetical protein